MSTKALKFDAIVDLGIGESLAQVLLDYQAAYAAAGLGEATITRHRVIDFGAHGRQARADVLVPIPKRGDKTKAMAATNSVKARPYKVVNM